MCRILPLRALEFGPIEELRQKHGTLAAVAPLPRAHFTKPNIVIKPNANSRPTGDTTGYLANPEGSVKWEMDGMNGHWLSLPYWVNA